MDHNQFIEIRFHAARAHRGVEFRQALLLAWMSDGVKLEFQREQRQSAIARELRIHLAQRIEPLLRRVVLHRLSHR